MSSAQAVQRPPMVRSFQHRHAGRAPLPRQKHGLQGTSIFSEDSQTTFLKVRFNVMELPAEILVTGIWVCFSHIELPLTTKAIFIGGSCSMALHRIHRTTTKKMILVVEGTGTLAQRISDIQTAVPVLTLENAARSPMACPTPQPQDFKLAIYSFNPTWTSKVSKIFASIGMGRHSVYLGGLAKAYSSQPSLLGPWTASTKSAADDLVVRPGWPPARPEVASKC